MWFGPRHIIVYDISSCSYFTGLGTVESMNLDAERLSAM